jgi:hypothetical protein
MGDSNFGLKNYDKYPFLLFDGRRRAWRNFFPLAFEGKDISWEPVP